MPLVRLSEPSRWIISRLMDKFFGSFYVKYLPLNGLEPFLVFNGRGFAWSGESAVGTELTPYNRSDAKSKANRQSNFREKEFR